MNDMLTWCRACELHTNHDDTQEIPCERCRQDENLLNRVLGPSRALSFKPPWGQLVVGGYKPVDNRPWRTKFRGRIYVHASLTEDKAAYRWLSQKSLRSGLTFPLAFGALIGEVDIVDCVDNHPSPWFFGPRGLVLARPKAYDNPIPYKGRLGFFHIDIPREEVLRRASNR